MRISKCVLSTSVVLAILVVAGLPRLAPAANFTHVMNTVGQAWGDYNNDGYSDIFGKSTYWTNDYANNPGNPFIEHPNALDGLTHTWNTSLGDYNNDGFIDAFGYIAGQLRGNEGGKPVIYQNDGGTGWTDVTSIVQPASLTPASVNRGHHVVDINGDGFLDMYATSWVTTWVNYIGPPDRDVMWTNSGGNSYSHTWTSPSARNGKGSTHCDFDRDGDQDIYVSNYWYDVNYLWVNNGSGGLSEKAGAYGAAISGHTQGSTFGDFNNDGDFDIFVSNFDHASNPELRFLINGGEASDYRFTDVGKRGVIQLEPFDSGVPADFDNDGDLDLFTTTHGGYGNIRARLYANNGAGGEFQMSRVDESLGLLNMRSGTTHAAWGDFDNDGFVDLIADGKLWHNPGAARWPDNHYLKIKLKGGQGDNGLVNQAAIGAQVRVEVPGVGTVTRQVSGSTGQGMQNDLTVHLGLGTNTDPVDVEIFWPDGTTHVHSNVAVDQYLIIDIADGKGVPTCNFNGDSVCNEADLEAMYAAAGHNMVNGVSADGLGRYDLNHDDVVDNLDIDEWLVLAGTDKGYATPFLRGDTNGLDNMSPDVRQVNLFDYNVMAGFFDPLGERGPWKWSDGNFDGDTDIDISDYNALVGNFNVSGGYGAAITSVPEPAALMLLLVGLVAAMMTRRRAC